MGVFVLHPVKIADEPDAAAGFDEGFVGQALAGAGLTPAAFHPGTWRGRDHAMAFQDMIVAKKG
ncbi:MAG: hypothetical protein KIS81_12710 [Maricaulaceae bacterium]|nr:hypothetical protein [Maricaulaceae bacterium]